MVRRTVIFTALLLLVFGLSVVRVDNAVAEEDDIDIYVAPLDEDASDEVLREEAGSGFDTPGPFYILEDSYNAGAEGNGTWAPEVPEVSEPTVVEEEPVSEEPTYDEPVYEEPTYEEPTYEETDYEETDEE